MNEKTKGITLIVNPASGQGRGRILRPQIRSHFERAGFETQIIESEHPGHVQDIVAECYRKAIPRVVIAGGDGTIFEAVNGIMRSANPIPLGIVPIGSGNDFVKAVGIPSDWAFACDRIIHGEPQLVDIGRCNGHYFANGVGIGLDARIATRAKSIHIVSGHKVYYLAAIRQLLAGVDTPQVTLEIDDNTYIQEISLLAVANGTCFGGSFKIAPHSRVDDGELYVVVARGVSRWRALQILPKITKGRHTGIDEVQYYNAKRIVVTSAKPLPIHLDGELIEIESNRYEIEVIPKRLNVIV